MWQPFLIDRQDREIREYPGVLEPTCPTKRLCNQRASSDQPHVSPLKPSQEREDSYHLQLPQLGQQLPGEALQALVLEPRQKTTAQPVLANNCQPIRSLQAPHGADPPSAPEHHRRAFVADG